MHHVELLPDATAEATVCHAWDRLAEAGLPSLQNHRSASNRPHVTLTVVPEFSPHLVEDPLLRLPLSVQLGPLLCFGAGPWVLVRLVVATADLVELHRAVTTRLGPPASEFYEIGRWVPHVTLAHGLDADQLSRAIKLLSPAPRTGFVLDRARHWDSVARAEHPLGGPSYSAGHD